MRCALAAMLMGAAFWLGSAVIVEALESNESSGPSTQADSLGLLLEQLKDHRTQESSINESREKEFLTKKNARSRLLEEARNDLIKSDQEINDLLKERDGNNGQLENQKESLQELAGDLTELCAVMRQFSGDLSAVIKDSLVSAQYPGRGIFLEQLTESRELQPVKQLEKLWFLMLQEMTESGKVVTFPAQVTGKEGEAEERLVSRIGVFSAVAGDKYLQYSPETERLMELPRQPGSHYAGLAAKLDSTKQRIVPMMIDPTRGSIVRLLVQKPNLLERIQQGGAVGYLIIFIGFIGIFLATFRHVALFRAAKRIENQLRNIETPSSDNPLGRVLAVLKRMDKANPETLELSLDEAVLKEIPHLERGHALIKLLAAVAPLLGLLGTVTGMIVTFQTITLYGTGDPKLMADGISQALVTTALGLLVAIPLLFAHSLVTARSKSLIQVLDQQSAGMIAARIEQHHGGERDRAGPIHT